MYRANHSVENTPASNSKEQNSVQLRFNNNDTNSRRERSLSAFTDDSFAEPCGFMDYYKAYKVENDIPPSELGDNEGLGNSNPIAFGTGIGRRNTVEVNHLGQFVHMKSKEISAISEQIEEVLIKSFFYKF